MNIITPQDIKATKIIPQYVLDVVNKHLKENYHGGSLTVKVDDIANKLTKRQKAEAFDKHYFDFEELYNASGWNCKFIKTAYYEPHDYWIFEAKY